MTSFGLETYQGSPGAPRAARRIFTTEHDHLMIDLHGDVPRFGLLPLDTPNLGGTGQYHYVNRIAAIPHGVPYRPEVRTFLFPTSPGEIDPDEFFQTEGTYYPDTYVFTPGAGTIYDRIETRVTPTEVEFYRIIDIFAFGVPYTSNTANLGMMVKYEILTNRGEY